MMAPSPVLRTECVRSTLWEALLPPEALVMPAELVAVDWLLDDARFFEPFRAWFDPVFSAVDPNGGLTADDVLKYRYRLGYRSWCNGGDRLEANVNDLFCRGSSQGQPLRVGPVAPTVRQHG